MDPAERARTAKVSGAPTAGNPIRTAEITAPSAATGTVTGRSRSREPTWPGVATAITHGGSYHATCNGLHQLVCEHECTARGPR